jgi:type I restriction enzyme S subunit
MQTVSNWTDVKLADVCALRAEPVEPETATALPYVGLEHIDSGQPRLARYGSPTEVRSLKNRFYNGDILYGKLRPYLDKAVCAKFEGICSTDILVFKPEPPVLSSFLVNLVHTPVFVEHAVRTTKGVNHPRTSWHSLSAFEFRLPPIEEQEAITRALDAVQGVKEARQRELALERERKAALMEFLFTHGIRGEPTTRTKISEIPESWQVVPLGKCAELITKGSSPNWQGFEYTIDGVVFVRSQNVGWGRLELTDVAHLPDGFNAKEEKSILSEGDILVNIVGASIGRAALATTETAGGNVNQAVALVRLRSGEFEPAFFMNYIFTVAGQRQLHSQKKDIARANLSLQDLSDFLVPLPPITEQRTIAVTANAAESKIQSLEREITLLEELFVALLEELMTGRLSPVPLIEEHQAK